MRMLVCFGIDPYNILDSFFFNATATTEIYTLSLHDALPISRRCAPVNSAGRSAPGRLRLSRNDWSRAGAGWARAVAGAGGATPGANPGERSSAASHGHEPRRSAQPSACTDLNEPGSPTGIHGSAVLPGPCPIE